MSQMTAAHPTLPFGTWVAVENRLNGRSVEVRINDRGPFKKGRILDLSQAAARLLGAVEPGVIPVRLRVIGGSTVGTRSGAFSVQVASLTSEYRAVVLKNELVRAWPDAYVQRSDVGGRVVYHVRVGKYATRGEAQQLAQRVAAAGYDVIVIGVALIPQKTPR